MSLEKSIDRLITLLSAQPKGSIDSEKIDAIKEITSMLEEPKVTEEVSNELQVSEEVSISTAVPQDIPPVLPVSGKQLSKEERDNHMLEFILFVEGKYFNHANDPGGKTMYGIIESVARRHGYKGDMRNLPKSLAIDIYKKDYISKFNIDSITHLGKALCVLDFVVNSGTRGITMAQKACNKAYMNRVDKSWFTNYTPLLEDGKIGPKTIEAINNLPFFLFYTCYITAQEDKYHDLMTANGKLRVFEEGWENRIHKKNSFIFKLLREGVISYE